MSNCNENYIREAAYYLWQNAGCPNGQDDKFWSMALEQFSSCNKTAKKPCCCKKSANSGSAKKPAAKSASKTTSKK